MKIINAIKIIRAARAQTAHGRNLERIEGFGG